MRIADSRKGISGLFLVAAVSILAVVVGAVAVAIPLWGSPGTTTNTQTTTDKSLGISLTLAVTPQMGPAFVEALPVGKFHGVAPATTAKMNSSEENCICFAVSRVAPFRLWRFVR